MVAARYAPRRRRRGFSLLEVIIASGVLAITVAGAITAMYVTSRMARDARYDVMAMEALNRQVELLKAGDYDDMGPINLAAQGLPTVPNDLTWNPSANFVRQSVDGGAKEPWEDPFVYDPALPDNAPTFTCEYVWYGFGVAAGGSTSTLVVNASDWPADLDGTEFVGSYAVFPTYGAGYSAGGQVARISGATVSGSGVSRQITFTLDARLTNSFTNTATLLQPVASNTIFFIDGGKWCRVVVSWLPPWAGARAAATGNDVEDYRQTRVRDVFIGDPDIDGAPSGS